MPRLPHLFASLIAAAPLALAGCTDDGTPTASNAPSQAAGRQAPGKGQEQKPGQEVTPDRQVDTEQGRLGRQGGDRGGRVEEPDPDHVPLLRGGRPLEDPRRALRDRRPGRAPAGGVGDPRVQPDDQGEGRAGQAALLRPADLEGRHGQLRLVPRPGQGLDRQPEDLDRDRRPDRRPERPDGPEHRLRPDDVLGRPGAFARRPGAGADPEQDRDGRPVVQADRRAAPGDLRLPRAVPQGLRHRRDPRRHGQGDRRLRADRPVGQLGLRQVQLGRPRQARDLQGPDREPEARDGPLRPPAPGGRPVQGRRRPC